MFGGRVIVTVQSVVSPLGLVDWFMLFSRILVVPDVVRVQGEAWVQMVELGEWILIVVAAGDVFWDSLAWRV